MFRNDSFGAADLLALSVSALIIQHISIVFSYVCIFTSIYIIIINSEIFTKNLSTFCSFEASIHYRILK